MNRPRGTSILFVNTRWQVLLFLRDRNSGIPFPDRWDVPGGHIEENETPEECIQREMKEEIGIDVGSPPLFHKYDMTDRTEFTFWQAVDFNLAKIVLYEGQRMQWFTQEEILRMSDDDFAFDFRKILLDFFREQPFETYKS